MWKGIPLQNEKLADLTSDRADDGQTMEKAKKRGWKC